MHMARKCTEYGRYDHYKAGTKAKHWQKRVRLIATWCSQKDVNIIMGQI